MRLHWRVALCHKCDLLAPDGCRCDDPDYEWITVARVRLDTHAEHKDFVGDETYDADCPF